MALDELLNPRVIVILPRFTEAVETVFRCVVPCYPGATVVALSDGEVETRRFAGAWDEATGRPLHILRYAANLHLEVAGQMVEVIAGGSPNRGLGIILADSAEVAGFEGLMRARWNHDFAESLARGFADLQVVEYSTTWKNSPPRIR